MAAAINPAERNDHVAVRDVRPGSCVRCMACHDTIDFVPGGARTQITRHVYADGVLQHIELFHPDCFAGSE